MVKKVMMESIDTMLKYMVCVETSIDDVSESQE